MQKFDSEIYFVIVFTLVIDGINLLIHNGFITVIIIICNQLQKVIRCFEFEYLRN